MVDQQQIDEIRSVAGLDFVMAVWLIVSPYVLAYSTPASRWNQAVLGIIVAVLAALRYLNPLTNWVSWLMQACGTWLIVAPFILDYGKTVAYWNEAVFGAIITVLAFWHGAMVNRQNRHYQHPATR